MRPSTSSGEPLDPLEQAIAERLDSTPEAEWPAAIEALCAERPADAAVIRRRFALLHGVALDRRAAEAVPTDRIEGYVLLRRIGSGGMGVAYLARQESTGREVVVKVIRPDYLDSPRARTRFRREVEAVARLDHPGICTIFEAGETDGRPFLAMRYVPGEPLSQRITSDGAGRDSILDAVSLVESVARALHVAHDAGLVHRDVKPANIIIQPDGEPVLLDFGLVHAMEGEERLTRTGEVVGTPAYMSPEQVSGSGVIDRRSDVYSLGVTLFELLTGRLPFAAPTRDALYRQILAGHSTSATAVNPAVPRDLSVVLAAAMERDAGRRYATALDFAEDLRRVATFEPILARPAGPVLRLRRWTQRNPVAATLSSSLAIALLVALWLLKRGDEALGESLHHLAVLESSRLQQDQPIRSLDIALDEWRKIPTELAATRLREAASRSFELHRLTVPAFAVGAWRPCFAPDGETVWLAGLDLRGLTPTVARWNATDGIREIPAAGPVSDLDVDPGTGRAAIACPAAGLFVIDAEGGEPRPVGIAGPVVTKLRFVRSGLLLFGDSAGQVRLLDLENGRDVVPIAALGAAVRAIAVAPGGRWAGASTPAGGICRIDLESGTHESLGRLSGMVDRLQVTDAGLLSARNRRDLSYHVFGPDGRTLLDVGGYRDPISMALLVPDAAQLLAGHLDQTLTLQDVGKENLTVLTALHAGWVFELDVSPDGTLIASGAGDGSIVVWDRAARRPIRRYDIDDQPTLVRFFPGGGRLLVGARRGPIHVFAIDHAETPVLRGHRAAARACVAVDGPGRAVLITADAAGSIAAWDAIGRRVAKNDEPLGTVTDKTLAATPDGQRIAAFSQEDGQLRVWRSDLRQVAAVQLEDWTLDRAMDLAVAEHSVLLVSAFRDGVRWRRFVGTSETGLTEAPPPAGLPPPELSFALTFSRDGKQLLVGCADGTARSFAWSEAEVTSLATFRHAEPDPAVPGPWVEAVAFSPDGTLIATGATDGIVRLWNADGSPACEPVTGHAKPIVTVAFAPDTGHGPRLLSLAADQVRIWHLDGRTESAATPVAGMFTDLAVLPDGERFAMASTDGTVRIEPVHMADVARLAESRRTRTHE